MADDARHQLIRRTCDAAEVAQILRNPGLAVARVFLDADVAPIVNRPENVVLIGEHGVSIFTKLCAGLYEWHVAVLPQGRGAWVREAGDACLRYAFTETDAVEIVMRPAATNVAAIAGCRMLGAHLEFVTRLVIRDQAGRLVSQHVYVLRLTDWLGRMAGDDPAEYRRFAADCPAKGTAALARFWSLSGRAGSPFERSESAPMRCR